MNGNSLIVISPHPDDETLGAGGTILRMKALGRKVYWLNVTNMSASYGWDPTKVQNRMNEIARVRENYGIDEYFDLALEPMGLDKMPMRTLVDSISEIFHRVKPEMVISPWKGDPHSDHRITYEAVMACTKSFRFPFVKTVLCMEILSETNFGSMDGFGPQAYVDVSDWMEKKIEITKIYASELGAHPFPRSLEAIRSLGTLRGSECGCKYAEAFHVHHILNPISE